MFKTNRPSEENGSTSGAAVPRPHFRETPQRHFRSQEELSDWLDGELDLLEAMFADFSSKASLRGYFSR